MARKTSATTQENSLKVKINYKGRFGRTSLSWAAEKGHAAVVELLLETGNVNVYAEDEYNRTPLLRATENGHVDVVEHRRDTRLLSSCCLRRARSTLT